MGFTEKQRKVISVDEGNVVVSASAGSGKTSVMIERIIRLIVEGKADISQILAVTFTNASAKEIRDRITKVIRDKIAEGENKKLFIEQIEKLPVASISTIHSFCIDLIRTYFYVAEVDPSFTVLDETGAEYMKNNALNDVFESLYESSDPDILALLNVLIKGREDKELKKYVLSAFAIASSEENFDGFFENALSYYTEEGFKIVNNRLIDEYIKIFRGFLESLDALKEYSQNMGVEKYATFFEKTATDILSRIEGVDGKKALENIYGFTFERFPAVKNYDKSVLKGIKDEYDQSKKVFETFFKSMKEAFAETDDERLDKTLKTALLAKSLVKIVRLFKEKYDGLKRDACVLDFNDLERFALKILQNEEIRLEVSEKYKYIFVDEYQDTNGVQEAIFSKIANDNLFIVGDVKQSIYAFRGCNPDIFNKKINDCATGYGEHIDLDSNFRSVKSVIDATNKVFSGSMKEDTSGVDYSKAVMQGGSLYGENIGEVKLHIAPKNEKEDLRLKGVYSVKKHAEKLKATEIDAETKTVCDIIEDELFGNNGNPKIIFDVKEKKEREITYGDICVLTRAKKGKSDKILSELVARSIPVICENKRPIGEYPEIKVMVNLLQFIVSPTADIPLATVLKSAIGGFSDEELSAVRGKFLKCDFYSACKNYRDKSDDEISRKLTDFFNYFEKIRILAQFESASRVLKTVTSERGYELKLLANKLGEMKLQRVNRFILAGENRTVNEMLNQIDSIIESLTVNQAQGANAVKIMSYHSSKGLEFPVVILADVSKNFNRDDLKKEILFDRDFGFALKYYDVENKICRKTAIRYLLELKKKFASSTDELRLFYVAMTRAKNKLHLVSSVSPNVFRTFYSYALATKMIDFIRLDDLEIASETKTKSREKFERRPVILGKVDKAVSEEISGYINFQYPHLADTALYLKRTVTEVNKTETELFNGEDFSSFEVAPSLTAEDRENLQDTGTAYHRYLETCNFDNSPDNELIRLQNEGLLTEKQVGLINAETLCKILSLDIFKLIKNCKFYREQPFILYAQPKELNLEGEDCVLLQGVIDLLLICGEHAYVVDYKYSSKSDDKLAETYRKQLDLYAYATEKILKKQVKGKFIVNLKLCRVINV